MPDPELKEWLALVKDALLGIAALVTIFVGIYGVRTWKRDLVGKEIYAAAKNLVKESHLVARAARKLREPIFPYEKRHYTDEEIKNTTKAERWRLSEAEAYQVRIEKFSEKIDRYELAKLELRILVGSKVYGGYLPFGKYLNDSIIRVGAYIDLLQDYSHAYSRESKEITEAQHILYPSNNLDDELSQNLANSREKGEILLLEYLHRKSIHG